MRSLVTIRVVDDIQPITFANAQGELEEASNIEKVVIDGWNLVVQKGRFEVGQLCVYAECDTILPKDIELFSFLEGKRIKTKKLKGVISQGVLFTIPEIRDVILSRAVTDESRAKLEAWEFENREDITELVGATKYDEYSTEKADNSGARTLPSEAKGRFPSFIIKTDEERIQNRVKELKTEYIGEAVIEREKLHGSSITIYFRTQLAPIVHMPDIYDYGVCSRNLDLKLTGENNFVKAAIPALYRLSTHCMEKGLSIALQGELIGPGINGNPYGLTEHQIRFFTAQDISERPEFYTDKELMMLLHELELEPCPYVDHFILNDSLDYLLVKVEGKSKLNPKYTREGSVIRSIDGKFSFKVINNIWLLKEKD